MIRKSCLVALATSLLICSGIRADFLDPNDPDVQVFTAIEDDGFSRISGETLVNRGKTGSIRCKTNQEMVIMKFDLSSLAGWTITDAELHVCASSASELYAADIATIAVPWTEGSTSGGFNNGSPGDPCWDWRRIPVDMNNPAPDDYWTVPGSNFTYATYGNSGSLVSFAHPADGGFTKYTASTPGGEKTFYRIKLDPDIVHALILDQYGLTLSDTRGYLYQNNTVYTHDQWGGAAGPWLYVKGGITDTTPPGPVTGFTAEPGDWTGEVLLSWVAPTDSGPKGKAFGYDIRYAGSPITEGNFADATPVPRWQIPRPIKPGQTQMMVVRDLVPGATYYFGLRAYDQAGNATAIATTSLTLPPAQGVRLFEDGGFTVPAPAAQVRSVGGVLRYWAATDCTKVNPVTGNRRADGYTGSGADGYKKANPVWDAANNKVILRAARNEVVAFQLILERLLSGLTNVAVQVSDLAGPGLIPASPNVELFRCWYVPASGVYYPDACIPLSAPFASTFNIPNPVNGISGQRNQSVWVDIYVPKGASPGTYTGTITVTAAQLSEPLQISLELLVRNWQLPDEIGFIVDLNGYHNPWGWSGSGQNYLDTELRYFQLGHKHRQNVNTVPYSHTLNSDKSPRVDSNRVPTLTGSGANIHVAPGGWDAFDAEFGRFLDGSAFTPAMGYTGPGMGTPIPAFYTPFFESWPLSSYFYYDANGRGGAYWYNLWPGGNPPKLFLETAPAPHVAYPPEYETGVKNIVREWAEHAQAKGWHGTYHQFYLNNKFHWGNASNPHSQFWNLDEPTDGDCFLALGYFNQLFVEGVASADAPDVKWHFRVDISDKTGFHRAQLDGRINLWDCSYVNTYHGLIPYRKLRFPDEQWWYYGGGPSPAGSELANSQRFLQVWAWGVDGALPYWNCYSTNWNQAETLSIVYSGQNVPGHGTYYGAIASVRMKQMRRGQQDIEYLMYLANSPGWDRSAVTRALRARYADPSGDSYNGMNDEDFFKLREDVAATIEAASKPALLPDQSEPPAGGTLPNAQNNTLRLVFDQAISLPGGPALVVSPLGGGADVGGQFIYSLATTNVANDTLVAVENGAVLNNLTWYRIAPAAGFDVEPFTHDVYTLMGDANGDGRVDLIDLLITVNAFGTAPGDPYYNPAADLDGDEFIDLLDVIYVVLGFGQSQ